MAADYGHFEDGSSARFSCKSSLGAAQVIFRLESTDPELLLQARRRCRVLEHQPLVRIDVAVGLLRHQRTFVEAAQDQLQLAGIGVDIADGENSRDAGLERRSL